MSLFLLPLLVGLSSAADPSTDGPEDKPVPLQARVLSVYDGDTFTLDTGDRVRLRWVNTPELKPAEDFGIEARDLASRLILNKKVTLDYGSVKRDGYGRVIAGVTTPDGTRLSEALLEAGFAHLFIIPPLDDADLEPLLRAQRKAQAQRLGIWSDSRYQGELHITSFHANARGNDFDNPHGEYLRVCNVGKDDINLEGYRLIDRDGFTWSLPSITLPVGYTVQLVSGKGENQPDPDKQIRIYLQSDGPVWNNKRDRATLYDPTGRVLDTRLHAPKSRQ